MASYRRRAFTWTVWKEPQDFLGHVRLEQCVLLCSPLLIAMTPQRSHVRVGQALGLGVCQRFGFDQDTLPLVSLTSPAETNDDRAQPAALLGAPGQCHISSGQVNQLIEIGTGQAEGTVAFHDEEAASAGKSSPSEAG